MVVLVRAPEVCSVNAVEERAAHGAGAVVGTLEATQWCSDVQVTEMKEKGRGQEHMCNEHSYV